METYPQLKKLKKGWHRYAGNPVWSIGQLSDDYTEWSDDVWPVSGDDIALYRAGVERAS